MLNDEMSMRIGFSFTADKCRKALKRLIEKFHLKEEMRLSSYNPYKLVEVVNSFNK